MKFVQKSYKAFAAASRPALCAFSRSRDGNMLIMFAFMLGVLMMFAGGAVDYTRFNTIRADAVESLDAAALAIARYDELGGPDLEGLEVGSAERKQVLKDFGKSLFHENFAHEESIKDLDVEFNINQVRISACARGDIPTLLLHVGRRLIADGQPDENYRNINLDTCAQITRRGTGQVELALVLDVTGSMGNPADNDSDQSKLEDLKDAVDNLLEVMYGTDTSSPHIRVGVVPFNAYVNPGGAGDDWDDDWEDTDAEAYYHGAHFFHTDSEGQVDENVRMTNSSYVDVARLVDPDRKVNHYDLYESADVEWRGCVEARPYPLDELDVEPGSSPSSSTLTDALMVPSTLQGVDSSDIYAYRAKQAFERAPSMSLSASEVAQEENTRWVPFFHPDEPDCDSNACNWDGSEDVEYTMTNGVDREFRAYGYFFDSPNQGDSESAYNNENFIDDDEYTDEDEGLKFAYYADVVYGWRYAVRANQGDLNAYWDSVREMYEERFLADDYGDHEYRIRNSYVGVWDEASGAYRGKYDQNPRDTDHGEGANRDCPEPILPLTDNRTDVETHMGTLSAYGNTNAANGAVWGWRLLAPEAPFPNDIDYDDNDWQKAVIIMTDGVNVASGASTHWDSRMSAYGYAIEERMGDGVDRAGRSGNFSSDRMANQIDEKLLRVCHRMKEKNVLVYTIVFGLDDNDTETVFRACATQPDEPFYFKAPSGSDLEQAFGAIAADLVNLHISQ